MATRSRARTLLFRGLLLVLVCAVLEGLGYLCMWYNSRGSDHFSNRNYFSIRHMLMGSDNPEQYPRYLSLPGLGYVPYPGYAKNGRVQHNRDGYRGEWLPLHKTDKYRILCLGGSTTYGSGVPDPAETYPARLQEMADAYIRQDTTLSRKYTGAEVLNAGLEGGTSADELRQYLGKYRYYRADLVIVHSGINDALLAAERRPDFQLDYTHAQRLQFHLEPLRAPARWCMRSYLFSFLAIRFFYDSFAAHALTIKKPDHTFVHWSQVEGENFTDNLAYYPFYANSKSLYREVLADSARLLVLANVLNPRSPVVQGDPMYAGVSRMNDSLSKALCAETGAVYVPFGPAYVKNDNSWLDDCHLDAAGEKDKALAVWPYVKQAIR